jgi:TolA-binding protein
MRSHFLLVSSFAATFAVAGPGIAEPQGNQSGVSADVSVGAAAGTPPETAGARPSSAAPASPYKAALAKGHAAYLARDFPGAMSSYKEAIAQDGTDPAAHYFLGQAQAASGSLVEADGSFAAGLRNAAKRDDWHGKLLFVVADLRERQGKWPEAKKGWEEYAQFLSTHPGVQGYPATATERAKAVDGRVDLETKYAPVKQRIEQRAQENAAVPSAADEAPPYGPPPPPAKKK